MLRHFSDGGVQDKHIKKQVGRVPINDTRRGQRLVSLFDCRFAFEEIKLMSLLLLESRNYSQM